jgi:hypothetical protein
MLGLFRRIRRRLALIRYYSAPRARNRWTRVQGWGLAAAFVLPFGAIMLAEALTETSVTMEARAGGLVVADDGTIRAHVREDPESTKWSPAWVGAPYGEWRLEVAERRMGWPFGSLRERQPARVRIHVFDEATPRVGSSLAAGDPVRPALEAALDEPVHRALLAAWREPEEARTSRNWLVSITTWAVWWVIFSLGSIALVRLVGFSAIVLGVKRAERRHARRSRGRCVVCDYDLRGLEFNERCPECGTLLD